MKLIKLEKRAGVSTKDLLRQVMNQNPRGMQLDEMRRRIAMMDAVDAAAGDSLVLKDEDFRFIVECLKSFIFTIAHKDVMALIDAVIGSEDAPAPFAPAPLKPEANGAVRP